MYIKINYASPKIFPKNNTVVNTVSQNATAIFFMKCLLLSFKRLRLPWHLFLDWLRSLASIQYLCQGGKKWDCLENDYQTLKKSFFSTVRVKAHSSGQVKGFLNSNDAEIPQNDKLHLHFGPNGFLNYCSLLH